MRFIVYMKVCIICMFAATITFIDNYNVKVSVWDMRSGCARVSAEGRLRIGVGVVYCSFSYVSSSVSGMSVGGLIGYLFD
jgi:hypothetical protein